MSNAGQMNSGYYASGGLALAGHGAVKDGAPTITLTSTGFTVYYEQLSASHFVTTNSSGGVYYYLAFFF